jgi:hypothetical protein
VITAPLPFRRTSPANIGGNVSTTPNDTTAQSQQIWNDTYLSDAIYDAWCSACEMVDAAYRSWAQAAGESKADTYLAFVASLDQEEAAARHLRSCIETPGAEPEIWPCLPVKPATGPGCAPVHPATTPGCAPVKPATGPGCAPVHPATSPGCAPVKPATAPRCAPVKPATDPGGGERSAATPPAVFMAPPWVALWTRLPTPGAQAPHRGPRAARPDPADPSR